MRHEEMLARCLAGVEHLGGVPDARALGALLHAQDLAPRRHHTTTHLAEMWTEANRLVGLTDVGPVPAVVDLAIAFHDVVYDPTGHDNEAHSAARARTLLVRFGVGEHAVDEVARLVAVTADHVADAADLHAALVVDADLWILAAPEERYDRYVADVRAEYGHVDDHGWRAGRGRVLEHLDQHMAGPGYLVGPDEDRQARIRRARANLARERADLITS